MRVLLAALVARAAAVAAGTGTCSSASGQPSGAADQSQSLLQSRYTDRRAAAIEEGALHDAAASIPKSAPEAGHAQWNYSATGAWAKDHVDCVGAEQSPVNFDVARVEKRDGMPSSLAPMLRYKELSGLKLANNGHSLQVNGAFGSLELPDGTYNVKQFHFHFPSEHAVDGVLYQGELHIVHQHANATGTDRLAVIGVLLQDQEFLSADLRQQFADSEHLEIGFLESLGFASELPKVGEERALPADLRVNLAKTFAVELAGPYFHYQGSLTTPPCSESVHWYVLERPAAVTAGMVARFRALFPEHLNNRPVQMMNGRIVVQGALATAPAEFEPVEFAPIAGFER